VLTFCEEEVKVPAGSVLFKLLKAREVQHIGIDEHPRVGGATWLRDQAPPGSSQSRAAQALSDFGTSQC